MLMNQDVSCYEKQHDTTQAVLHTIIMIKVHVILTFVVTSTAQFRGTMEALPVKSAVHSDPYHNGC